MFYLNTIAIGDELWLQAFWSHCEQFEGVPGKPDDAIIAACVIAVLTTLNMSMHCSPCTAAAVKVFEFVDKRGEAREGRVCQSFAPGQRQPLRMGGFYWNATAQTVCQHFMVSLHDYD